MGEVMATLLLIVDAWYELAKDAVPNRFHPADRVEVLGQLVRLVAHRFHGFRWLPRRDDVRAVLNRESVGLVVRSPARPLDGVGAIERHLATYGFSVTSVPESSNREIMVSCKNLTGAQILAFPQGAALAARRRRR
jgi:hypothetical protein